MINDFLFYRQHRTLGKYFTSRLRVTRIVYSYKSEHTAHLKYAIGYEQSYVVLWQC